MSETEKESSMEQDSRVEILFEDTGLLPHRQVKKEEEEEGRVCTGRK